MRFIESAANSELYEAYQLVVTVLGVISFLYYSYNVTFQYTSTSAEYVFNESSIGATDFCTCCMWGCGCRGWPLTRSTLPCCCRLGGIGTVRIEAYLVSTLVLDMLLRLLVAQYPWQVLLSWYTMLDLAVFFTVAYYLPMLDVLQLNSKTEYVRVFAAPKMFTHSLARSFQLLPDHVVGTTEVLEASSCLPALGLEAQ